MTTITAKAIKPGITMAAVSPSFLLNASHVVNNASSLSNVVVGDSPLGLSSQPPLQPPPPPPPPLSPSPTSPPIFGGNFTGACVFVVVTVDAVVVVIVTVIEVDVTVVVEPVTLQGFAFKYFA